MKKKSKLVSNESIYDLASLTKVLSTTSVVMNLITKKIIEFKSLFIRLLS